MNFEFAWLVERDIASSADKVTSPEGQAGLERILKLGTQRAACTEHPLHSLLLKPLLMRRLVSKVWAGRWTETRRRVRDKLIRPEIQAQRDARSVNLLRKRRASHSWTATLKKLKANSKDANSPFFQDDHSYNLALESCRAVYLPDFDRGKDAKGNDEGPYVLRLQPWLTEDALGFQELARNNRPIFGDTVAYVISEQPGTSKPPKDIPAWMLAKDGQENEDNAFSGKRDLDDDLGGGDDSASVK